MGKTPFVTFVDVEASGLARPASYPIEVGWADTLGNSGAFLIRPAEDWQHWDPVAEQIHGIPRAQLLSTGITIQAAAERLNQALGCETVYCDALDFDAFWLGRLFESAGIQPSFRLADLYELLSQMGDAGVRQMWRTLKESEPPHRAEQDASRLVSAYLDALSPRQKHRQPSPTG